MAVMKLEDDAQPDGAEDAGDERDERDERDPFRPEPLVDDDDQPVDFGGPEEPAAKPAAKDEKEEDEEDDLPAPDDEEEEPEEPEERTGLGARRSAEMERRVAAAEKRAEEAAAAAAAAAEEVRRLQHGDQIAVIEGTIANLERRELEARRADNDDLVTRIRGEIRKQERLLARAEMSAEDRAAKPKADGKTEPRPEVVKEIAEAAQRERFSNLRISARVMYGRDPSSRELQRLAEMDERMLDDPRWKNKPDMHRWLAGLGHIMQGSSRRGAAPGQPSSRASSGPRQRTVAGAGGTATARSRDPMNTAAALKQLRDLQKRDKGGV